MIKKLYIVTLLAFLATTGFAQDKSTIVKSNISFKIKNLGFYVDGTFSGLKADVQFNPANLTASTIEASVPSNTVNTDNDSRDNHLKSEDYFNVAKYPAITIKSVSFKHKSGGNYTGQFNVTIKDKTKLVEIPFTYTETGNTAAIKGSFQVLRTDFGIGDKSSILSNEAIVSIDAEVNK